jgi:hypothetical protein
MRLTLRRAIVATALLVLSIGIPVAGAVSGPDANDNSKFVYTQEVVSSANNNLLVTFEEGGQKRFDSMDYRLDGTVTFLRTCDGQSVGQILFPSSTTTGLVPDEKGRAGSALLLEVDANTDQLCTGQQVRVEYLDMTLTNLTSGHVYELDDVLRTYP